MLLALLVQSCSLLNVSIDSGVVPLEKSELNKRLSVRLYTTNFTESIIKAADTIYALSDNYEVKLNSIIWKANSTQACMSTSLHSIPESGLLNTWIFVSGMNEFMQVDSSFQDKQYIAQITSETMLKKYEDLAKKYLTGSEYRKMSAFVDSVVVNVPYTLDFNTRDYTSYWQQFANIPDSVYITTYGSIPETLGDLSDKATFLSTNVSNQLGWIGDKAKLRMDEGVLDSSQVNGLRELEESIVILKQFMANAPAATDSLTTFAEEQLLMMMENFQTVVNNTLLSISNERVAIEEYVSKEREAILLQSQEVANELIKTTIEQIPTLIKSLLLYIILGMFILLGVPLTIGFYLGKYKGLSKKKKEQE